jgi:hypothetical protein
MELNIPPIIGEYGYFDIKNLLKEGELLGYYIYSTTKQEEFIHGSFPVFKDHIEYINRGIVVKILKTVKYYEY